MKLMNCVILTLLLASSCLNLYCQQNNADIIQIRKAFNEINGNKHLNKLELDAEEFLQQTPDGGASLTGYFDNAKLVKISSWIGFSYGIRQVDYYFRHDTLIFAFVTERHFKIINDSVDFEHTDVALEARYYFNHNKLIDRKVKGRGFWDKEDAASLLPDSITFCSGTFLSKLERRHRILCGWLNSRKNIFVEGKHCLSYWTSSFLESNVSSVGISTN
jgi:hypothetical protein